MPEKKPRGRPPGTFAKGRNINFFAPAAMLQFLALRMEKSSDLAAKGLIADAMKQSRKPAAEPATSTGDTPTPKTPPDSTRSRFCTRCLRVNSPACDSCRKLVLAGHPFPAT